MRKKRNDIGRPRTKYSSDKRPINKTKKCISLDKDLWASIDLQRKDRNQNRSEFINHILRTILGSTKSFLKYQLLEKSAQLNYAKFKAQNYNAKQEIEETIKDLKAGR